MESQSCTQRFAEDDEEELAQSQSQGEAPVHLMRLVDGKEWGEPGNVPQDGGVLAIGRVPDPDAAATLQLDDPARGVGPRPAPPGCRRARLREASPFSRLICRARLVPCLPLNTNSTRRSSP